MALQLADYRLTAHEKEVLSECEIEIERGLETFYKVGKALLAIRDQRLYREEYGTFEEYCQQRWQMGRRYANRIIDAYGVIENLGTNGSQMPANERQIRPIVHLEPEEQKVVWDVVQKTAVDGKITAAHVKSVVDVLKDIAITGAIDRGDGIQIPIKKATFEQLDAAITEETHERIMRQKQHIRDHLENKNERLASHQLIQQSDFNEWYTPERYIKAVYEVMTTIDVDPASNDYANTIVQATSYYTLETNGLDKDWNGRVFLNPPYGRGEGDSNQDIWSSRLIEQYKNGITKEAILLINAVTDRKWFQPLWEYTICFTDHRIRFYDQSGEFGQPTHGNAFVYFGNNRERFINVFKQFGVVVERLS